MDKIICDNYVAILKNELIASFGCTEPIVIAYASAKPERCWEKTW